MRSNSTKASLHKYLDKHAKEFDPSRRRKKKNNRPEKEVEKEVMEWLKRNDFSCHVVESKAVFSASAGIFLHSQADPGMSDIIGCTPDGMGCFIELKAKGKKSTLKMHQRKFLLSKIARGAFSVCVDSVEYLEKCWDYYKFGGDLTIMLPKLREHRKKAIRDESDDLPF